MIKIDIENKTLVNTVTGETLRPECFDYLSTYYAYLTDRKHYQVAEKLLEDVFKGEKVISKMIANAQKHS